LGLYIFKVYIEKDTITGVLETQYTRRWLLSHWMSKDEVVGTAFKCIMTSMEHRAREWFLYNKRPIFGPHQDIENLWANCENRVMRKNDS
jgi:hypothetical protein